MPVAVKRIYEKPARSDGARVLVDRLWPRGVKKSAAALDAWLRELAPSDELRQWFHSCPDGWAAFRKRYLKELSNAEAADALRSEERRVGQGCRTRGTDGSIEETHWK